MDPVAPDARRKDSAQDIAYAPEQNPIRGWSRSLVVRLPKDALQVNHQATHLLASTQKQTKGTTSSENRLRNSRALVELEPWSLSAILLPIKKKKFHSKKKWLS